MKFQIMERRNKIFIFSFIFGFIFLLFNPPKVGYTKENKKLQTKDFTEELKKLNHFKLSVDKNIQNEIEEDLLQEKQIRFLKKELNEVSSELKKKVSHIDTVYIVKTSVPKEKGLLGKLVNIQYDTLTIIK